MLIRRSCDVQNRTSKTVPDPVNWKSQKSLLTRVPAHFNPQGIANGLGGTLASFRLWKPGSTQQDWEDATSGAQAQSVLAVPSRTVSKLDLYDIGCSDSSSMSSVASLSWWFYDQLRSDGEFLVFSLAVAEGDCLPVSRGSGITIQFEMAWVVPREISVDS